MVAPSSCTVTKGGVSMVAWVAWALILALGLTHTHASTSSKYGGDVSGEEVVIDQLKDFLRSRQPHDINPSPYRINKQKLNEKIDFAVTPQDPRYYLPLRSSSSSSSSSSTSDLLSPDLVPLQRGREYPPDLLQYQDEEPQYQQEYPYHPQYRQGDEFPPSYLRLSDLQYPQALDMYPDPRFMGPESPQQGPQDLPQQTPELQEYQQGLQERLEEKRKQQEVEASDEELLMKNEDEEKPKKVQLKAVATSQPEELNYSHRRHSPAHVVEPAAIQTPRREARMSDLYFAALVAGLTAMAVCGVVGAGICWYRLNKSHRAAQDAEYPAYGVTGPNKDLSPSSGDRKLAQSAHMYHYQHQKQQMIALDKSSGTERHGSASDVDSEEEGEENEYTVYECPGLAPTDEMEVKNPLFHDDPTPATPSVRKEAEDADDDEDEEPKTK